MVVSWHATGATLAEDRSGALSGTYYTIQCLQLELNVMSLVCTRRHNKHRSSGGQCTCRSYPREEPDDGKLETGVMVLPEPDGQDKLGHEHLRCLSQIPSPPATQWSVSAPPLLLLMKARQTAAIAATDQSESTGISRIVMRLHLAIARRFRKCRRSLRNFITAKRPCTTLLRLCVIQHRKYNVFRVFWIEVIQVPLGGVFFADRTCSQFIVRPKALKRRLDAIITAPEVNGYSRCSVKV